MNGRNQNPAAADKRFLFEEAPVRKALMTMAVPTVISQLINLVYNIVDAYFIGRTGNPYMAAATTLSWTLVMLNTALSNLYGVGGGSLVARLMGAKRDGEAKRASAFTVYCGIATALGYAIVLAIFLNPLLRFLGASDATIGFAAQYTTIVLVFGSVPTLLSAVLAHLIRNAGFADKASIGLSGGGLLNIILDPLLMFVILPRGYEVAGAALATLISNTASCVYLLLAYRKAGGQAALSIRMKDAKAVSKDSRKQLFSVGIPSAALTGLFDLANICVNMLASAHSDFVLAGMGITMKVERIPTAINLGICHGAMPIVAYNYSSGNRGRMMKTIGTARLWGLVISGTAIVLFQLFAGPLTQLFMNIRTGGAALETIAFAALFLQIRCIASPFQFLNYHTSYSMQAMGNGKATIIHALVRELIFYIPFMFILDHVFGETGLAAALIAGEGCGAIFAIWMLQRNLKKASEPKQRKSGP